MPQSRFKLPSGDVISHHEVVYDGSGKERKPRKAHDGKHSLLRFVKGTAKMVGPKTALTDSGRVFELVPAHWVEVTRKGPDSSLVVE